MQIISMTNLAGPAGIRVNGRTTSALALTAITDLALESWAWDNAAAAKRAARKARR